MRNLSEVEMDVVNGGGDLISPVLGDNLARQQTEDFLRQQGEKDRYESVNRSVVGQ